MASSGGSGGGSRPEAVTLTFARGESGPLPSHDVAIMLDSLPSGRVASVPAHRSKWQTGEIKLRLHTGAGEPVLAIWTAPVRHLGAGGVTRRVLPVPGQGRFEDLDTGMAVIVPQQGDDDGSDDAVGWYEAPLAFWRTSGVRRPLGHRRWVQIEVDAVDRSRHRDGFCSYCGNQDAKKKCSGCKRARYCGADCQRAHWRVHKPQCRGA